MRSVRWIGAFLAIGLAGFLLLDRGKPLVHISGDLAFEVTDRLLTQSAEISVTQDPDEAKVVFIAVTDWEKLAFVPGADCGPPCDAENVRVVRILDLTLTGFRKTIYVNIGDFLSDMDREVFAFSDQGLACILIGYAAELGSLRQARWPDSCVAAESVASKVRLFFL